MASASFLTSEGLAVPSVTAAEMREVDRVATEEVGLTLLMMMEHAGRGVADIVQRVAEDGAVTVLAGGGGNGGGGLCAARHLANHGREVSIVLDRDPAALSGAPERQWRVLGPAVDGHPEPERAVSQAAVVVDALVGYSLQGPPRGRVAELVGLTSDLADRVVALDVPTGVDATSGERPGVAIEPDSTVTLALPKRGLAAIGGDLWLADLGIPARVFERVGLEYESPFEDDRWYVSIERPARQ